LQIQVSYLIALELLLNIPKNTLNQQKKHVTTINYNILECILLPGRTDNDQKLYNNPYSAFLTILP